MKKAMMYLHGRGGSADEAIRYKPLCGEHVLFGIDYRGSTPWDTKREIAGIYTRLAEGFDSVSVIGNSIGAYFAMNALRGMAVEKALLISPIVDMERLILDMMAWANVSERELMERGEIPTAFGETLSWEYLQYARMHPIEWRAPTHVLYAEGDALTARGTVEAFCRRTGAALTVMPGGEHWFHTPQQMRFLDDWIKRAL